MRVIKVKRTSPPPKKTPRLITLEITEGELDYLAALAKRSIGMTEQTPAKYGQRLLAKFEELLGGAVEYESDAYKLSSGIVRFFPYKPLPKPTRAKKIESLPYPNHSRLR